MKPCGKILYVLILSMMTLPLPGQRSAMAQYVIQRPTARDACTQLLNEARTKLALKSGEYFGCNSRGRADGTADIPVFTSSRKLFNRARMTLFPHGIYPNDPSLGYPVHRDQSFKRNKSNSIEGKRTDEGGTAALKSTEKAVRTSLAATNAQVGGLQALVASPERVSNVMNGAAGIPGSANYALPQNTPPSPPPSPKHPKKEKEPADKEFHIIQGFQGGPGTFGVSTEFRVSGNVFKKVPHWTFFQANPGVLFHERVRHTAPTVWTTAGSQVLQDDGKGNQLVANALVATAIGAKASPFLGAGVEGTIHHLHIDRVHWFAQGDIGWSQPFVGIKNYVQLVQVTPSGSTELQRTFNRNGSGELAGSLQFYSGARTGVRFDIKKWLGGIVSYNRPFTGFKDWTVAGGIVFTPGGK